jgi:hypothetical protein
MKAWLRWTLVLTSVGGGFIGVVLDLVVMKSWFKGQRQVEWPYVVLFLVLNIYVTASGLLFVQNPNRTRPLLAALAIQVPRISSPLLVYAFSTALQLSIGLAPATTETGGPGVRFMYDDYIGTTWTFDLFHEHPLMFGINLWALAMLVLLWRSVRRMTVPVVQPTNPTQPESGSAPNC